MSILKKLPIISLAVGLTACASFYDTSVQDVTFVSSVEQVGCIAKSPDHTYEILAPDIVTIERTHNDIQLKCTKNGYKDFTMIMHSKFNPTMGWNVLNGMIPGTAYDFGARGAYEYPSPVMIKMLPLDGEGSRPAMSMDSVDYEEPVIEEPISEEPHSAGDIFAPEDTMLREDLNAVGVADDSAENALSGRK